MNLTVQKPDFLVVINIFFNEQEPDTTARALSESPLKEAIESSVYPVDGSKELSIQVITGSVAALTGRIDIDENTVIAITDAITFPQIRCFIKPP
jgi:hypothetical protein